MMVIRRAGRHQSMRDVSAPSGAGDGPVPASPAAEAAGMCSVLAPVSGWTAGGVVVDCAAVRSLQTMQLAVTTKAMGRAP